MGPGFVALAAPGQGGIQRGHQIDQGNCDEHREVTENADIEGQGKVADSCSKRGKDGEGCLNSRASFAIPLKIGERRKAVMKPLLENCPRNICMTIKGMM